MSEQLRLHNLSINELPDLSNLPLKVLDLHGNFLRGLEGLPLSLEELNVSSNSLDQEGLFLPFPSLVKLDARKNNLNIFDDDDFVMCFPILTNLDIAYNNLRHTGFLRNSVVEHLNVAHNRLHLLSGLPLTLKTCVANSNDITLVQSKLPPNLVSLDLGRNCLRFAGLPLNWPSTLRELHLSHNMIEKFPRKLPETVEIVNLSYNNLTELPQNLPSSLHTLLVFSNRIQHLPLYIKHKKFQLFLIHDNCLTDIPETFRADILTVHENWNTEDHQKAQKTIKQCWKRYVFTLRLRHYKRTQKTKEELFIVSMMPERWDQIDTLSKEWFRKDLSRNRTDPHSD